MMKICLDCNIEYPETAKFCRTCGKVLTDNSKISAEFQAADSVFKIRIKENPEDPEIFYEYFRFLIDHNCLNDAIALAKDRLEHSPKDVKTRHLLANAYTNSGDLESSIAQLLVVESIQGTSPMLNLELAKAYFKAENADKAKDRISRYLDSEPESLDGIRLLADIQAMQGDMVSYEATLKKHIDLHPEREGLTELIKHLISSDKIDNAYSMALKTEKFVNSDPEITAFVTKAKIHRFLEDEDKNLVGIETWLQAAENAWSKSDLPKNLDLGLYRLFVQLEKKADIEPDPNWNSWLVRNPDSAQKSLYAAIYERTARLYGEKGNTSKAISECKKSVEISSTPSRYSLLITLYLQRGQELEDKGDKRQALLPYNAARKVLEDHSTLKDDSIIMERIDRIENSLKNSGRKAIGILVAIFLAVLIALFVLQPFYLGKIDVSSNPDGFNAAFFKDISSKKPIATCTTPCSVDRLLPGTYHIVIKKEDFNVHSTEVEVTFFSEESISASFLSSVEIKSIPNGVLIKEGGETLGKTPLKLENMTAQNHSLTLSRDFYRDKSETLYIMPNDISREFEFELTNDYLEDGTLVRRDRRLWIADPPKSLSTKAGTRKRVTYFDAYRYCNELQVGPWKWRLPTAEEMKGDLYMDDRKRNYAGGKRNVVAGIKGDVGNDGIYWVSTVPRNASHERRSGRGFGACRFQYSTYSMGFNCREQGSGRYGRSSWGAADDSDTAMVRCVANEDDIAHNASGDYSKILYGGGTLSPDQKTNLSVLYSEGGEDSLCSDNRCLIKASKITSSSVLENKSAYASKNIADGEPRTAWCEGVPGVGIGEWIRFDFGKAVDIAGFFITPFYAKSKKTLFNNCRIKSLKVEWEGSSYFEVRFNDEDPQHTFAPGMQADFSAPYVDFINNPHLNKMVKTTWVKFTILDVYPGKRFKDTCISDVLFSNKSQ